MSRSIGVAPASIVRASGVSPSRQLAFCPSFILFVLRVLSFRVPLFLLVRKAHVPSRPRVLRTYVHTRPERERPTFHFPPHWASGRRPIGPYPAQKHRTAHDRACSESGGERKRERERARAGGMRGEAKRKNRSELKRGSRKIIRFPRILLTKIRACVRACARERRARARGKGRKGERKGGRGAASSVR